MKLSELKSGDRFRAGFDSTVTGTLVSCTNCQAVVDLDEPRKERKFETADGEEVRFQGHSGKRTGWGPGVEVELIGHDDHYQPLKRSRIKMPVKKDGDVPVESGETPAPEPDGPAEPNTAATTGPKEDKMAGKKSAAKKAKRVSTALKASRKPRAKEKSRSSKVAEVQTKTEVQGKEQKPKKEYFVKNGEAKDLGPFKSVFEAIQSVDQTKKYASLVHPQHYFVLVGEKKYTIITTEAAKRDAVDLGF